MLTEVFFLMFAVVHIKCSHSARQLLRDDVFFLLFSHVKILYKYWKDKGQLKHLVIAKGVVLQD